MLLHVQVCAFKVGKRSNRIAFPDGLDRRLILMISGPMFHDVRRWGLTTGGRSWVGMGALACFRSSLMSDRSWGSCASNYRHSAITPLSRSSRRLRWMNYASLNGPIASELRSRGQRELLFRIGRAVGVGRTNLDQGCWLASGSHQIDSTERAKALACFFWNSAT